MILFSYFTISSSRPNRADSTNQYFYSFCVYVCVCYHRFMIFFLRLDVIPDSNNNTVSGTSWTDLSGAVWRSVMLSTAEKMNTDVGNDKSAWLAKE